MFDEPGIDLGSDLDWIRFRHDPSTDWDSFFDALWERRSELRDDL